MRRGFFFGALSGNPLILGVSEAHWDAFRFIIEPKLPEYAAFICRFDLNGIGVFYPTVIGTPITQSMTMR